MVFGVIGLLGGGKSYYCVRQAVLSLLNGNHVSTNIELNLNEIAKIHGVIKESIEPLYTQLDSEAESYDPWSWLCGDPRGTPNQRKSIIIIDEAGEWFSIDQKKLERFKSWLRQSDKRGQDVYLIVQDASILNKQGRVLVHRWIRLYNNQHFKTPWFGWRVPPPWRDQIRVGEYDQYNKQELYHSWIYIEDKYYRCYNTAALFGASAIVAKTSTVRAVSGVGLRNMPVWLIWFMCFHCLVLALIWYCVYLGGSFYDIFRTCSMR